MKDKSQEYQDRYKEWTRISLSQLSVTNNLLLTISIAFLAFCFEKDFFKNIYIDISQSIIWKQVFYFASIITLLFSIVFGIGVIFSRLYDFRISRNLALTRKRVYAKFNQKLIDNNISNFSALERGWAIFQVIFLKLPFISKIEVDSFTVGGQLSNDFDSLQRLSKILGSASWRWTKLQTFMFFLSVIFYIFHLWSQ